MDRSQQHTYLHTLVRCARKPLLDGTAAENSTEERMAALEQTVWALTGKVGRVEETLSRIERLLLASWREGRRIVDITVNTVRRPTAMSWWFYNSINGRW